MGQNFLYPFVLVSLFFFLPSLTPACPWPLYVPDPRFLKSMWAPWSRSHSGGPEGPWHPLRRPETQQKFLSDFSSFSDLGDSRA